jgi:hypothetical protein
MARLLVTVTEEMDEALKRVAEQRGAPVASLLRQAAEKLLEENGETVKTKVVWGNRKSSTPKSETSPTSKTRPRQPQHIRLRSSRGAQGKSQAK